MCFYPALLVNSNRFRSATLEQTSCDETAEKLRMSAKALPELWQSPFLQCAHRQADKEIPGSGLRRYAAGSSGSLQWFCVTTTEESTEPRPEGHYDGRPVTAPRLEHFGDALQPAAHASSGRGHESLGLSSVPSRARVLGSELSPCRGLGAARDPHLRAHEAGSDAGRGQAGEGQCQSK